MSNCFKYILKTPPSGVKKSVCLKTGGQKSSRNMKPFNQTKLVFLVLGSV